MSGVDGSKKSSDDQNNICESCMNTIVHTYYHLNDQIKKLGNENRELKEELRSIKENMKNKKEI